jgi:hypothetical protein
MANQRLNRLGIRCLVENLIVIFAVGVLIFSLPCQSYAQKRTPAQTNTQNTEGDQSPAQNIGPGGTGIINYNCPQEKPPPTITHKGKPKLPPTTAELEQNLREQILFLHLSAANFDKCLLESEAKRMAASLHILFVDTEDSSSLLEQMRIRDKILLPNTGYEDSKGNLAPYIPLVVMSFGEGRRTPYLARGLSSLGGPPQQTAYLHFDKWWHKVILDDHKEVVFTRETLVKSVAQQDGGIKVSSGLDPSYVELSRTKGIGWRTDGDKPILGVELHSIRQIVWEVLDAISKQYPEYLRK